MRLTKKKQKHTVKIRITITIKSFSSKKFGLYRMVSKRKVVSYSYIFKFIFRSVFSSSHLVIDGYEWGLSKRSPPNEFLNLLQLLSPIEN